MLLDVHVALRNGEGTYEAERSIRGKLDAHGSP